MRRALLLAGLLLMVPLLVSAIGSDFGSPLPLIKSVGLQATIQVDGTPLKSPVTVGANTEFTITWKSLGTGCVSNWDEETLPPTGSAVGSIERSRAFVLTCFGRGAGQSATMQVNVGVSDLTAPAFSVSGLRANRKIKNTYFEGPFTLKASVKNLGKLSVSKAFKITYEISGNKESWVSIGERTIAGLRGGTTLRVEELLQEPTASADVNYYRFCVDTGATVTESNEENNCSKILGPYTFVEEP